MELARLQCYIILCIEGAGNVQSTTIMPMVIASLEGRARSIGALSRYMTPALNGVLSNEC